MKNINKVFISISIGCVLTSCSTNQVDREETPVELRQRHVVQSENLYCVQNGDTVGSIAIAHGVKRGELISANNLLPPYELYPGQRLIIPTSFKQQNIDAESLNSAQDKGLKSNLNTQNSKFNIVQKGGLEVEYGEQTAVKNTNDNKQEQEESEPEYPNSLNERSVIDLNASQELVEVDETPISTATYVWPVANGRARITKSFDAKSGNILISTPGRTPVKAVADGIVKMAGKSGNEQLVRFGNMIVIQHKDLEKVSIYANVIDLKVKSGQKVSAGDLIASVSQSGIRGMTTNPVLYFELDKTTSGKKRQPVNPCDVLP